jgi:TldD protein
MRLRLAEVAVAVALVAAPGHLAASDSLLDAMRAELDRSRTLKLGDLEPPYYIEYSLDDISGFAAIASMGGLLDTRANRVRTSAVQVRVGGYKFDNTNYVGTDYFSPGRNDAGRVPLDGPPLLIRRHFWLATDRAYKRAVEGIARKRSALRNVTQDEQPDDFSPATPIDLVRDVKIRRLDEEAWSARVRTLSGLMRAFPDLYNSSVEFQDSQNTHYFVNTEGSKLRVPEGVSCLRARARARAADGTELWHASTTIWRAPAREPSVQDLATSTEEMARRLVAMARAPVADAYVGPVLFEGKAAAQLFAELLSRNVVLTRRPVNEPGMPLPVAGSEFENRLGARVLPEWMSVVDDPTRSEWRGKPLIGHYEADMEGVRPVPVELVVKGVLKSFLTTRQPVKGFPASNGRARMPGSFGARSAAASNLFVEAAQAVPLAALRGKFMELCKSRGKPYGMVVRAMDFPSSASLSDLRKLVAGMARGGGEARPVSTPFEVYRVYPDGREELVRGLRFRGLGARSLKDILAASQEQTLFEYLENGAPWALLGVGNYVAETSVVAPSVLFDDLELERMDAERLKPPIVPPPGMLAR